MIGVDIIEIDRIEKALKDPAFARKVFTEKERAYCEKYAKASVHYAGRFAAKEAIVKAFGVGFGKEVGFHDIEILPDEQGAPRVSLYSKALKGTASVSISHCKNYAVAFAIAPNKQTD